MRARCHSSTPWTSTGFWAGSMAALPLSHSSTVLNLVVRANDLITVFRHMRITELVAMRLAPLLANQAQPPGRIVAAST
jgi:hypothetical protein